MKKEYNREDLVATCRFDYNDGAVYVKWNPYLDYTVKEQNEMQRFANFIIHKKYNSLDAIQEECDGIFLKDTKLVEEYHAEGFLTPIRLYPCKGEYNGYIYFYRKETGLKAV